MLITASQQNQQTGFITEAGWPLGIVNSFPDEEIPDGGLKDALNVVFDADNNLASRNGVDLFVSTAQNNRITSMFRAEYVNGAVFILFTAGTQLYRVNEDGTSLTNITGGLTLPNDVPWQWAMFGNLAIGVNGATSGTNPVKVDSAGTAAALGGSPPRAKYIDIWNNRAWLVRAETNDQNTIFGSALGLPEDWTIDDAAGAVSIDIDRNDSDFISGIKAFKGSLFVFKRRKIYEVNAISSPATNPSNLRVDLFTGNLGCVSPYSIQPVLDDLLFLSESGVASLTQAPLGDLRSSILSNPVAELQILKKTTDFIPAYVFDDVNQYILSVPSNVSPRSVNEVYVLDYQRIKEGLIRWTRFEGGLAGTAYSERLDGNNKRYLIGAHVPATGRLIYLYEPLETIKSYSDNGNLYTKWIRTKAYNLNNPLIRKFWHRYGLAVKLDSTNLGLLVQYYYDNNSVEAGNHSFNFSFSGPAPSLYGTAIYGTSTYSASNAVFSDEVVWRLIRNNSAGKKSRLISFQITNAQLNQGFILKFLQIQYSLLNMRAARTE